MIGVIPQNGHPFVSSRMDGWMDEWMASYHGFGIPASRYVPKKKEPPKTGTPRRSDRRAAKESSVGRVRIPLRAFRKVGRASGSGSFPRFVRRRRLVVMVGIPFLGDSSCPSLVQSLALRCVPLRSVVGFVFFGSYRRIRTRIPRTTTGGTACGPWASKPRSTTRSCPRAIFW